MGSVRRVKGGVVRTRSPSPSQSGSCCSTPSETAGSTKRHVSTPDMDHIRHASTGHGTTDAMRVPDMGYRLYVSTGRGVAFR
eukprot:849534-Rhodomonas_salina.1